MTQPLHEARTLRWSASGGDAFENIAGRLVRLDLAEARDRAERWARDALVQQRRGNTALACRVYAHDALELQVAISAAYEWRRAAGWKDPFKEQAA